MEFGADIVAYSATKMMDGQGRVLAGAVCGTEDFITNTLLPFTRNTGPTLSAFNAWVVLKGLETLDLRIRRQSENALEVGRFPRSAGAAHPASGPAQPSAAQPRDAPDGRGGPIFAFEVEGRKQAHALLDALELVDISNNIGDSRSLMTHPASTTHSGVARRQAAGDGRDRGDAAAERRAGGSRRRDRRSGSGIAGGRAMIDGLFGQAATTDGITVRVGVSFLADQSDVPRGRWFWSYHIRIENNSGRTAQLLTRHWIITDGRGVRHSVEGEGVVGEQPVIEDGDSYDYVSGCPLSTPSGAMQGSYLMTDDSGLTFHVAIPRFVLIAPAVGV